MKQFFASFALGILFGVGLLLSGMTNPAKVQGFLDITGHWDPSLALVMVGAIATAIIPFQWALRRRQAPAVPSKLDAPLVVGSMIFGIGWGMIGICPGPALVNSATGYLPALVFVAAMLAGIKLTQVVQKARAKTPDSQG